MMRRDILTTFLAFVVWQETTIAAPPASEVRPAAPIANQARPAAPTRRTDKAALRAAQPRNQEVQVDRVSARPAVPVSFSTPVQVRSVATPPTEAGLALVPPANDSCAFPTTVSGLLPIATPFDTFDTLEIGDGPIHSELIPAGCVDPQFFVDGGGMDHDLWYCWTSTVTGPVQVDTCASIDDTDTRLAVYNGCACPTNDTNLLACNDDGCSSSFLQSRVSLNAQSGQDYMIRVGRFPGDLGTGGTAGILTIDRLAPPCSQPGVNCQEPGQAAATDAIRSDVSGSGGDRLVADDFNPTASGDITEICWWGIYVGPGVNVGEVANCLNPMIEPGFLDQFSVRYYSDAGGIPGDLIAGPFVMPTCSNIAGKACTSDADCKTCSVSGAPCQTIVDCGVLGGVCEQIATCTDPAIRLTLSPPTQTGFILPLLAPFQEYEYSATHAPVPVTAGACYWIEISNSISPSCPWFWEAGVTGNGRAYQDNDLLDPPTYEASELVDPGFDAAFCLDVETGDPATACNPPPPPNDDCATGSQAIFDGLTTFDTVFATTDGPGESGCGFSINDRIDNDIWFDYVATCLGTLSVDLCGSAFDTRVAIYEGGACPISPNQAVACDDNSCGPSGGGIPGLQSHATLSVLAGQSYKIRIGGFDSAFGVGQVQIECVVPASNDNCMDSVAISDGITLFNTLGATTDGPTEQGSLCFPTGPAQIDNDVWFDYVATCSGTLFVDLCGSSFDTRAAVYAGSTCPAAPDGALKCDDNSCGPGGATQRRQAHVTASVTFGQPYKIRIGGSGLEAGSGEVRIGCGANLCEVAQRDCCEGSVGPGCNDPVCCNLICSLDPFCCSTVWDDNCAILNPFVTACSLSPQLCSATQPCPLGETCISADAANFCPALCSACPDGAGTYDFIDPPNDITDARQPHPIDNAAALQGFQVFTATAPPGAETTCWQFCSTDATDPNIITSIVENSPGTYTIALANPIKAGATTTIQYTSTTGNTIVTGTYTALPGDVDGLGPSNSADLGALIECLNSGTCFDWECDTDRSGTCSGADVEWAVNLLNGAGDFISWDQAVPASDQPCP